MTPAERQQRSRRRAKEHTASEQARILKKEVSPVRKRDQARSGTDRWSDFDGTLEDLEVLLLRHPPEVVEIDYPDRLDRVLPLLIRLKREARRVPYRYECDECHKQFTGRAFWWDQPLGAYCSKACREAAHPTEAYSPGGWAAEEEHFECGECHKQLTGRRPSWMDADEPVFAHCSTACRSAALRRLNGDYSPGGWAAEPDL